MLGARGLAREEAEDICQEVAWRVLSRDIPYRSPGDLYPWAATAARRLSIDLYRRQRYLAAAELPDRPAIDDVAEIVETRSRLRAVAEAMPALSETDRAALAATPTELSRREGIKLAVRRHRARARLLALVEAAGIAVAWVLARVPRRLSRPAGALAMAAGPLLVFALSYSPVPSSSPEPVPRSRAEAELGTVVFADVLAEVSAPTPPVPASRAPAAQALEPPVRRPPAAPATPTEIVAATPSGDPVVVAGKRDAKPTDPIVCANLGTIEVCVDL